MAKFGAPGARWQPRPIRSVCRTLLLLMLGPPSRPKLTLTSSCFKIVLSQLQDKADAAGLPRTVRALAVASAVTVLFFVGSWTQAFLGFFVAATYWRTLLVPKEVSRVAAAGLKRIRSSQTMQQDVNMCAKIVAAS